MAVSRIIEFKQNSQEARKKKKTHDMVGNAAFPPFNGRHSDSCVSPSTVQIIPRCNCRICAVTFGIKNMSQHIMTGFFFFFCQRSRS